MQYINDMPCDGVQVQVQIRRLYGTMHYGRNTVDGNGRPVKALISC